MENEVGTAVSFIEQLGSVSPLTAIVAFIVIFVIGFGVVIWFDYQSRKRINQFQASQQEVNKELRTDIEAVRKELDTERRAHQVTAAKLHQAQMAIMALNEKLKNKEQIQKLLVDAIQDLRKQNQALRKSEADLRDLLRLANASNQELQKSIRELSQQRIQLARKVNQLMGKIARLEAVTGDTAKLELHAKGQNANLKGANDET